MQTFRFDIVPLPGSDPYAKLPVPNPALHAFMDAYAAEADIGGLREASVGTCTWECPDAPGCPPAWYLRGTADDPAAAARAILAVLPDGSCHSIWSGTGYNESGLTLDGNVTRVRLR